MAICVMILQIQLGCSKVKPKIKRLSKKIMKVFFLLVALQKTPSLLGAECQGVGTTPLHANERGPAAS